MCGLAYVIEMKKIVLTAFVLVFLLSAMLGTRFTAPAAADSATIPIVTVAQATRYPWPMFHHDLRHTGYTESPAPKTNKTLWVYTTGGVVWSSPAVADGVVYVGSRDYKVYALNATTGTLIWSYTTGGRVDSSPAVANGTVYVGSGDHRVYALDATTGTLIWSYATGGVVDSSPAVADGMIYIGSEDHRVYALDATTGTLLWSYTTGGAVSSSPALADGVVFVGSDDLMIYALNHTTGALIWNYTTGGAGLSSPAVAEGVVYIGSYDHKVYALNQTTGTLIWNYTTEGIVYSSPALADGAVFIGSSDRVYALDATTGALLWSYTTGWRVTSSPTVADGMVFIGCTSSTRGWIMCALNQTTGALIWSYKTGYRVDSSPAVADGVVYVGSADANVYAFGEHPPHYVVIKSVKVSPTEVMAGLPVSITVVVKNEGDETETFNISYNLVPSIGDVAIETKTVTNLAPGASETLTFNWNTPSIYILQTSPIPLEMRIKAVATTLTGEPINTLAVVLALEIKPNILPYVAAGIAIVAAAVIAVYFVQVRKRACFSVNLPSEIVFQQLMNYFKPKYARKYYFSTEKVSTSHIEGKWYFGTSPPSPVEPFPPPALAGYFKIDITSSDGKSQVKLRFSSPKSMSMLALGCFIVGLSSLILLTFGVMFLCFAIAIAFFFGGQWRTIDALQEMKQFLLNVRETVGE